MDTRGLENQVLEEVNSQHFPIVQKSMQGLRATDVMAFASKTIKVSGSKPEIMIQGNVIDIMLS